MGKVRAKDTSPELEVRRLVHRMGFRFRLYESSLPGTPDLVLKRHRAVIFVHGCFWHRHPRCRKATTPAANAEFWRAKFVANQTRDKRHECKLKRLEWKVLVVWECELKNLERLARRIAELCAG